MWRGNGHSRAARRVGNGQVAGQRIQLGRGYAHQVVTAHLSEDVIRIDRAGLGP